jgi:hypothetical protein
MFLLNFLFLFHEDLLIFLFSLVIYRFRRLCTKFSFRDFEFIRQTTFLLIKFINVISNNFILICFIFIKFVGSIFIF